MLALPGLINAHAHMELSAIPGALARLHNAHLLLELLPLVQSIWDGRANPLIRAGYEMASLNYLQHGISTVNTMDYRPEEGVDRIGASGMRAVMSHVASDRFLKASPADIVAREAAFMNNHHGRYEGRIRCAIGCQGDLYGSRRLWSQLARLRREYPDHLFHTHLFETGFSNAMSRMHGFQGSTDLMHRLGLLNERSVAAHLTRAREEDVDLMAEQGAAMLHCPTILSTYDHSGYWPPLKALRDKGVGMAIGLDDHYLFHSHDLFAEMRQARDQARRHAGEDVFRSGELLRMVTRDAADALDLPETGRLEPGRKADVLLLDLDVRNTPSADAVCDRVISEAGPDRVRYLYVDGRACVVNSRVTSMDATAVSARAREQEQLMARAFSAPFRRTGRLMQSLRLLHPAVYAVLPYRLLDWVRRSAF